MTHSPVAGGRGDTRMARRGALGWDLPGADGLSVPTGRCGDAQPSALSREVGFSTKAWETRAGVFLAAGKPTSRWPWVGGCSLE